MLVVSRVIEWSNVLGFKSCQGLKVPRETKVPELKALPRDRVFSGTHLRSNLTSQEDPSWKQMKQDGPSSGVKLDLK